MRVFLLLLFLVAVSCATKPGDDSENVTALAAGDPRVERARLLAQDSLQNFISYFQKHGLDYDYMFALKASFEQESMVEHMWSIPFSFDGKTFQCILNNEPQAVTNYALGDTVSVNISKIEDFIVLMPDSTIVGDFLTIEMEKNKD